MCIVIHLLLSSISGTNFYDTHFEWFCHGSRTHHAYVNQWQNIGARHYHLLVAISNLTIFLPIMYVCMYYVCMHVSMHMCIHVSMYVCMHVCMSTCTGYVSMHVCIYGYMYVLVYIFNKCKHFEGPLFESCIKTCMSIKQVNGKIMSSSWLYKKTGW